MRPAGSGGRYAGRNSRTRSVNTVIPRVQPTRSAITVAGIVGVFFSSPRIASSNASTADPAGVRSYFGGASDANAERTVFLEIPNVLAINLIGNPSARCNRRISAQSSTANNSLLLSALKPRIRRRGVKIRASTRGQFSGDADILVGGLSVPRETVDELCCLQTGFRTDDTDVQIARLTCGRVEGSDLRQSDRC